MLQSLSEPPAGDTTSKTESTGFQFKLSDGEGGRDNSLETDSLPTLAPPEPTPASASAPASLAPAVMRHFVDLYEVLQMPQRSEPKELRKQISAMYLEAQKNQDHRNPQKRQFFQELYEVYLPQARHLLLDTKRRSEYDAYLAGYKEDQVRSALVEEVLAAGEAKGAQASGEPFALVEAPVEENLTPEQLAERRAQLWIRWQESLEKANFELERLSFSPIELKARAVEREDYIERTMVEVYEENRRAEAKRERLRREEQAKREEEQERARAAEMQHRRELSLHEVTKTLGLMSRTYWAVGSGIFGFLVAVAVMYVIYTGVTSFGLYLDALLYGGLALTPVAGGFCAWRGASFGVEYAEKILQVYGPPQKRAALADVIVPEVNTQMSGVAWALITGILTFVIGFAFTFGLTSFIKVDSIMSPIAALVGVTLSLVLSLGAGRAILGNVRRKQTDGRAPR